MFFPCGNLFRPRDRTRVSVGWYDRNVRFDPIHHTGRGQRRRSRRLRCSLGTVAVTRATGVITTTRTRNNALIYEWRLQRRRPAFEPGENVWRRRIIIVLQTIPIGRRRARGDEIETMMISWRGFRHGRLPMRTRAARDEIVAGSRRKAKKGRPGVVVGLSYRTIARSEHVQTPRVIEKLRTNKSSAAAALSQTRRHLTRETTRVYTRLGGAKRNFIPKTSCTCPRVSPRCCGPDRTAETRKLTYARLLRRQRSAAGAVNASATACFPAWDSAPLRVCHRAKTSSAPPAFLGRRRSLMRVTGITQRPTPPAV